MVNVVTRMWIMKEALVVGRCDVGCVPEITAETLVANMKGL